MTSIVFKAPVVKGASLLALAACALCAAPSLAGEHDGNAVVGSGQVRTVRLRIHNVRKLAFAGAMTVRVVAGAGPALLIRADDNVIPLLRVTTRDGVLRIEETAPFRSTDGPSVEVSLPAIASVAATRGVDGTIVDDGAGALALALAGSGRLVVTGRVPDLLLTTSGAMVADLSGLQAGRIKLACHDASSISVTAGTSVRGDVTGAAHVAYWGTARQIDLHLSGSATAVRRPAGRGATL